MYTTDTTVPSNYLRYQLAYQVADARRRDKARHSTDPVELINTRWARSQLERQGHKCFYSGVKFNYSNPMLCPSLERLNSRLGYSVSNVVLVCLGLNLFKGDRSLEQFQEALEAIVRANINKPDTIGY